LFGATRPEQVSANLGALAVADELTQDVRDRLARVGLQR
jgi:aryl-alcohol dehydrogenase-like predicted oxidoreductase